MSRFILFTLLVACLVALYQAVPVPQDDKPAPDGLTSFNESVQKMFEDAKASLDKMMENENVQNALKETKEFLENAGKTITEGAKKLASTE